MRNTRTTLAAKAMAILAVTPALIYAFSSGPPAGVSGAPGEGTCLNCHTGSPLINPSDNINLNFAGGAAYTPGGPAQRWTVTLLNQTQPMCGFQASARVEASNAQAGSFAGIDPTVKVITGTGM